MARQSFGPRLTSTATFFPSGDQQGNPVISVSKVNCFGSPPAIVFSHTLMVPLLFELNASRVPSGDNRAWPPTPDPRSASGLSFPFTSEIDQALKFPLRFEMNARRSPSGNQLGTLSIAGSLVTWVKFLPSVSMIQMSAPLPSRHCAKAILRPSREND